MKITKTLAKEKLPEKAIKLSDIFKSELKTTEKIVLARIYLVSKRSGICFESQKSMANYCGCSKNTIKRVIKSLAQNGIILINSGKLIHETNLIKINPIHLWKCSFIKQKNKTQQMHRDHGEPNTWYQREPTQGPL